MKELVFKSTIDVELVQSMGGDSMVVAAARVSTNGTDAAAMADLPADEHAGLINYLMKHRHGCFDSQTEVLTSDGWKFWPDVTGDEDFLTLNLQTDQIEYQKADRLVRKPAEGPLLHVKGAAVDVMVTPDHKMVMAPRTSNGQWMYQLLPCKDLLGRCHRFRLGGGDWRQVEDDLDVDEAELLGFIIADGSVGTSIEFHLTKARKIAWLRERADISEKEGKYRILNPSARLREWAKLTYTENGDRRIPPVLLRMLGPRSLSALIDGYLEGDGSTSEAGKVTASTVSRQLVDDLQDAAVKSGRVIVEGAPDLERQGAYGDRPLYRLTVYSARNSQPRIGWTVADRESQVSVVDYEGDVHCVTVPNGTLYVRRNGKPMWCGNTPFEHAALTFFVHAPILVWREWHRHRIGFCLAGDAEIWSESWAPKSGRTLRKRPIAELCSLWNDGVKDNLGRTRHLPSVKKQQFRVLNEDSHLFESSVAEDIFESGIKELFLLETEHPKWSNLKATKDHRILTSEGWAKLSELDGSEFVAVNGKRNKNKAKSIPPALRSGIGVWTSMQRQRVLKGNACRCYICGEQFPEDELYVDHVIPVVSDLTKALDVRNLAPACGTCHREKSNKEQKFAQREIVAGSQFVRLCGKPQKVAEEMTYDIAMSGRWHNFVANGIVVHNSYNEESGRYKELEPIFYWPDRERPMMKVEGWKPGRPKFVRCESDLTFDVLCRNLAESYEFAYERYQRNLALGVDPGLARDCLPVGIYSGCWVTCNPRSLMAFLSLRTHEPEADRVSYPLWEIEVGARACEEIFATGWPITYKAFCDNGRVAP